jgi:flavin reductase (DIM6/NTAB) family NADH-FMN oxidoreductase RutF
MPIDSATFRSVMGAVPTGITVLTIVDRAGSDHGMTVGAFCSLSLDPPLVLACIGDDATIASEMREATTFGISVLAEGQEELSRRFADREGRGFNGVAHSRGGLGTILLDGAVAQMECRITARHRGGDHTIVVGEIAHAVAHAGVPLVHHRGAYARLEHGDRKAP